MLVANLESQCDTYIFYPKIKHLHIMCITSPRNLRQHFNASTPTNSLSDYYKTLSYRIGVDREIPPKGSLNQVKPEACRGFYLI